MKRKVRLLSILLVVMIVGGGLFFLFGTKILVLQLENTDRPKTLSLRIQPTERFSVYYVHSVYRKPVIEEFEAAPDNTIVLKGVRTTSPAIAEQYGLDDRKNNHPMNERLGAIFFRVAPGEGQGVIVRDRKIYLKEVGSEGDRIQLSVRSISAGSYFLAEVSKLF